jgi:hypothetical protein
MIRVVIIYFLIVSLITGNNLLFASEKQNVEITTEPEFADIYIGNKFLGISPLKTSLEVGRHIIKVKHPLTPEINKKIIIKENGEMISTFHFGEKNEVKNRLKISDYNKTVKKDGGIIKPRKKKKNTIYYSFFLVLIALSGAYYGKMKIDEGRGSKVIISDK